VGPKKTAEKAPNDYYEGPKRMNIREATKE
jgi:hypothetical protein